MAIINGIYNSFCTSKNGVDSYKLSSYYKFDDNANDSYVNNLNGSSFGSPVIYEPGKFNSAIVLSSTTNYVEVSSNELLLPLDSNKFTISCWIKMNDVLVDGDFIYLFDWGQSLTTADTDMSFSLVYDTINWGPYTYLIQKFPGKATSARNLTPSTIGRDTNWHHLVIRVREELASTHNYETFVDGVRLGGVTSQLKPSYTSTNKNLRIGYNTGSTNSFLIDDLSIWQRPLSNDEISFLYNSDKELR